MSFQDEEKTAMTPPPSPDLGDRTVAVGERTQVAEPQTCPVCETVSPGTEQYCLDCGFLLSETPGEAPAAVAPPAVLVDHNGREFPLRIGENSIGRESADVLLNDSAVSRKHASITIGESAVEIEDLGSTNGTEVDGARISAGEKVALRDGSVVVVGSARLTLKVTGMELPDESVETDRPAPEVAPLAEESPPVAWLVAQNGQEFALHESANLIGRREDNDIRIVSDSYMSGRHAELRAEEGRFVLTDLGSTNGTFVNGEKLEPNAPRDISTDDEIVLGQTVLRLKLPDEHVPVAGEGEQSGDGGD